MWQMVETREDAISILGTLKMSPSEKLALADRYDVPAWVAPALLELVNREPPLSEEEVVSIGLTRAFIAVGLRERRHKSTLLKMAHCEKCDLMGRLEVHASLPCSCRNPLRTLHAPELTSAAIFVDCTEADVLSAFGLDPPVAATRTRTSTETKPIVVVCCAFQCEYRITALSAHPYVAWITGPQKRLENWSPEASQAAEADQSPRTSHRSDIGRADVF
jgi:hypothetical protein